MDPMVAPPVRPQRWRQQHRVEERGVRAIGQSGIEESYPRDPFVGRAVIFTEAQEKEPNIFRN